MPKNPKKTTIRTSAAEYLPYIATIRVILAKVQTLSALFTNRISLSSKSLIYYIIIGGVI